jgi:hypothetical protein
MVPPRTTTLHLVFIIALTSLPDCGEQRPWAVERRSRRVGSKPSRLTRLWALAMLAILSSVTAIKPALAQDVPPGFQRDKVATINRPTAFTFSPQDDLYAVSQGGRLFVASSANEPRVRCWTCRTKCAMSTGNKDYSGSPSIPP